MAKYISVKKFVGVVYYESSERKHKGHPDRCFCAVFKSGGKKIREKIGWASEGYSAEMAANIRGERMRDLRHGIELKKKDPLLSEVWKEYKVWAESNLKHPSTVIGRYELYLKPLAHKPLSKIAPLDIERIKRTMDKNGLSPQTVCHAVALLRAIFNKAIGWRLWSGLNPTKEVDLPKLSNHRERFLSIDEAKRLLAELKVRSNTVYGMTLLSLQTGMRLSEISELRWEHVDMDGGRINIVDSKNTESRVLHMTDLIRAYLGTIKKDMGLVFSSRDGEIIDDLSKTFMRVVEILELNKGVTDRRYKISFHSLRHTFASWLAIAGTPILTIKELMGHKTLAITAWYAKLSPDHKKEALKCLPVLDLMSKSTLALATVQGLYGNKE